MIQEFNGEMFLVAYASKTLLPRERAYSAIEKECSAIVWAIKRFHVYLYGKQFVVQTDEKPLVFIQQNTVNNARIARWSLFLQSYRFHVQEVKGEENVANRLSK